MEFEKIKELMNQLNDSSLMDFELKLEDGFYIRMNKYKTAPQNVVMETQSKNNVPTLPLTTSPEEQPIENVNSDAQKVGDIVNSPIVGTFYSSSSPTSPSFVKIGDIVNQGDTLCIVEAMKVMNEIKSPYSGRIEEILVKDEEMVEYSQPLFRIV